MNWERINVCDITNAILLSQIFTSETSLPSEGFVSIENSYCKQLSGLSLTYEKVSLTVKRTRLLSDNCCPFSAQI